MLLRLLIVAALLTGVPVAAQDAQSSSQATQATPAASSAGDTTQEPDAHPALPVSLDRIREQLLKTPAEPVLRGLNEQPTFTSGVQERLTLEDFFRPEDFNVGPVPAGTSWYANEMQRLNSNPVSDPLGQPYAAFSGGEMLTLAIQNLIFKYLGRQLTTAFTDATGEAAEAAARNEVQRAIAEYCAAHGGGAHIDVCRNRTAPR